MDYHYEENVAKINEELSNLDTIYIRAGEIGPINSTMIMDLIRNNADLTKYLPEEIIDNRDISSYVPNSVIKKMNLKS